ncbi:MAG: hypothetical protein MJY99_05965 [Fibrobacter sp.]|nr:hypothetical protein [Fibrobacter sp.]
MTVKELKDILSRIPDNAQVTYWCSDGYTPLPVDTVGMVDTPRKDYSLNFCIREEEMLPYICLGEASELDEFFKPQKTYHVDGE